MVNERMPTIRLRMVMNDASTHQSLMQELFPRSASIVNRGPMDAPQNLKNCRVSGLGVLSVSSGQPTIKFCQVAIGKLRVNDAIAAEGGSMLDPSADA